MSNERETCLTRGQTDNLKLVARKLEENFGKTLGKTRKKTVGRPEILEELIGLKPTRELESVWGRIWDMIWKKTGFAH